MKTERQGFAAFDAEIVIFLVCAVILVVGLLHHRFAVPETLAMLGLLGSARVLAAGVIEATRARRN